MAEAKQRVVVLGGGVGGMTAALELTDPKHGGDFDVTVYQLGWRLGGKGASGRNRAEGQRIEEHGLHLWFGFYVNAFRMMREVYDELGRAHGAPLRTIDKAFRACPKIVLWDQAAPGDWRSFTGRMPVNGGPPWGRRRRLPTVFDIARAGLRWARASLTNPSASGATPPPPGKVLSDLASAQQKADSQLGQQGMGLAFAELLLGSIVDLCERARDRLHGAWHEALYGRDPDTRARIVFAAIDMFVATGRGIHDDRVLRDGIEAIDGVDWTEWLQDHGAKPITVGTGFRDRSPVLRAVYDVAFSFPKGDVDNADAAAGTAMSDLLRLAFDYRGAVAYKMNAGMGDAIFAPIYDVLKARGVKFKFFHAVSDIRASADGRLIDEVEIVPQLGKANANLKYDPLVTVKGLRSWPSEPIAGKGLPTFASGSGRRLETELDPFEKRGEPITLKRRGMVEAGPDDPAFDHVVLAIPVGALPAITRDLIEKDPSFAAMVKRGAEDTVPTQAFQLWATEVPATLGVPSPATSVSATFVEPLDTYCDMGHVLDRENHPSHVKAVGYVCGVLPEVPGESRARSEARVKRDAIAFVDKDLRHIWNGVADPWDVLYDRHGRAGKARFDAQYWRANVSPWERYVITPSGNVATRLRSGSSGFANMVLAGDWTANLINGGCVEAAVISGSQAARALLRGTWKIEGEDPRWLTPEGAK